MNSKEALNKLKEQRELWEFNNWTICDIDWELVDKVIEDLELLEILLASLLKKPITNGTDSNKMILLDSQSYDKIREVLGNDK